MCIRDSYIGVRHQVSLGAADTIQAKLSFEQEAYDHGVTLQSFHCDRGTFAAKDFVKALDDKNQTIRYSGANTGFQAGVSERAIRTVVNMAQTQLLHAAMRWPDDELTPDCWVQALDYAVYIYNRLPKNDTGLSPLELFFRTSFNLHSLVRDCHVWGAPTYTLEPSLSKAGGKIPKWQPRSRRGMFMGFSPKHSTLVALVLNLTTSRSPASITL